MSGASPIGTVYRSQDSSGTTSSWSDQVKVVYNVDGSIATRSDQRGTVIVSSRVATVLEIKPC
jgi:hypothetical protein